MIGCLQLALPDEAALHALRLRLDQLSPRVQLARNAAGVTFLADLGRGTLRDGRRHTEALGKATARGVQVQIGIAPTPTLASLAARRSAHDGPLVVGPGGVPALLARCPIGWLAPLELLAPVFHGLGLRTLADVTALPAAAVGGRFGTEALRAWRALHGDEPPLTPAPLPPRLGVKRSFAGPVRDQRVLTLALARLTAQLEMALERRGVQARALALHLDGDDGPWSAARVLDQPAASSAALAPIATGLLRVSGVAGGVETLTLLVGELVPTRGAQLPLWSPTTESRETAHAALADLQARLAPGSLLRPTLAAPGTTLTETRGRFAPWRAE